MIHNRLLAKRYAKAFLHDKLGKEEFDKMAEEIRLIVECFHADIHVLEFFENPVYTRDMKLTILGNMAKKLSMTGYTLSLLELLIRKNRINLLADIGEALIVLADKMNNRVRVKVTTAFEPSPDELKDMSEKISKFFKCEVLVDRQIDPSIIAGFTIEGNGKLIDLSVLGQIKRALAEV